MMVAEVETEPTFNSHTPTSLFGLQTFVVEDGVRHFDLAPDGERFLMRSARRPRSDGLIVVDNGSRNSSDSCPSRSHATLARARDTKLDRHACALTIRCDGPLTRD